jgi:hypothetical protein
LIHTQIFSPRAFSRASIPAGSGKHCSSHLKVAPVELFHPEAVEVEHVQRQARSAIPSIKLVTVASS